METPCESFPGIYDAQGRFVPEARAAREAVLVFAPGLRSRQVVFFKELQLLGRVVNGLLFVGDELDDGRFSAEVCVIDRADRPPVQGP